jgi:hypothetical protein
MLGCVAFWIHLAYLAFSCFYGNEPWDFLKDGEFFDQLRDA